MDLNHLLYHHQLAVLHSVSQPSPPGARAVGLVTHYQKRIDRLRDAMGVSRYPAWCTRTPLTGAAA